MVDVENPSDRAYRIYVVEDSAILLRLLQEMLGSIPGVQLAGYSDNADEAIQEIVATTPDAIIVDLLLQSGTGTTCWKASPCTVESCLCRSC
jgi:chemotaxis response regulator CheB